MTKPTITLIPKIEFGTPVVFMLFNEVVSKRLVFYQNSKTKEAVDIHAKMCEQFKNLETIVHNEDSEDSPGWNYEVFLNETDTAITLIVHTDDGKKSQFTCANMGMIDSYIDAFE